MELSASLSEVLSEPRYAVLRHTFDRDLVFTGSGHLATGLARSLFAALNDRIAELFVEGVTIKSVFETVRDMFELPDCINLRQFYRYHAGLKKIKQTGRHNAGRSLADAGGGIMNTGTSRDGDAGYVSSPSSRPFLNTAAVNAAQNTSSYGPAVITRDSSEQTVVWDAVEARRLVPFNEGALVKSEVLRNGGEWPKRAAGASMIVLPGRVTNAAQAREFWSHISGCELPVPENLYPLKPDDPLYPFAAKTVLERDREDGFTFMIDDEGFVYDPLLVSKTSFGIPVPIPKWLMFYPNTSSYKDLRFGFGDYVNRWEPKIVNEILSFYPQILSFVNIRSVDEFVNVKRGVFEQKPKTFEV